jgi:Tfp pilus assembly protein PilF
MERCPICKARLKKVRTCSRCGTDLSSALNIEYQSEILLNNALKQLENGNLSAAKQAVEQSIQLKSELLGLALRGFIDSI